MTLSNNYTCGTWYTG